VRHKVEEGYDDGEAEDEKAAPGAEGVEHGGRWVDVHI
jgi:hypothetical protein